MKKIVKLIAFLTTMLIFAGLTGCNKDFVGLYDDVKPYEPTLTYTKENMMYDFEETDALHHNLYYNNIVADVSLNTDKEYVTSGNASMKLVINGRADKGYWSLLYLIFDNKFADFRKIKSINIDIMYEHPDEADVSFSIGGTGPNPNYRFETANKVYAHSGEWYTFTINPNEKFYAVSLGGTWNMSDNNGPGVLMPEDQLKAMNNLYISFSPFKQGQKPITLYLDNIYVEYFE